MFTPIWLQLFNFVGFSLLPLFFYIPLESQLRNSRFYSLKFKRGTETKSEVFIRILHREYHSSAARSDSLTYLQMQIFIVWWMVAAVFPSVLPLSVESTGKCVTNRCIRQRKCENIHKSLNSNVRLEWKRWKRNLPTAKTFHQHKVWIVLTFRRF
jgi:hypothetical protein